MRTIGQARALRATVARVRGVRPDSPRRWGRMNIVQMLNHLGGAMEWVLTSGDTPEWDTEPSRVMKFAALRLPLPWPKGVRNPNDPASARVLADDFPAERDRVIRSLEALSTWQASETTPRHPAFGRMSTWEWHRWAYKHADHHLRQFSA